MNGECVASCPSTTWPSSRTAIVGRECLLRAVAAENDDASTLSSALAEDDPLQSVDGAGRDDGLLGAPFSPARNSSAPDSVLAIGKAASSSSEGLTSLPEQPVAASSTVLYSTDDSTTSSTPAPTTPFRVLNVAASESSAEDATKQLRKEHLMIGATAVGIAVLIGLGYYAWWNQGILYPIGEKQLINYDAEMQLEEMFLADHGRRPTQMTLHQNDEYLRSGTPTAGPYAFSPPSRRSFGGVRPTNLYPNQPSGCYGLEYVMLQEGYELANSEDQPQAAYEFVNGSLTLEEQQLNEARDRSAGPVPLPPPRPSLFRTGMMGGNGASVHDGTNVQAADRRQSFNARQLLVRGIVSPREEVELSSILEILRSPEPAANSPRGSGGVRADGHENYSNNSDGGGYCSDEAMSEA
jgi:hypothetical protein